LSKNICEEMCAIEFLMLYFIFGYPVLLQLSKLFGFYIQNFVPISLLIAGSLVFLTCLRRKLISLNMENISLFIMIIASVFFPFYLAMFRGSIQLYSLELDIIYIVWPFFIGITCSKSLKNRAISLSVVITYSLFILSTLLASLIKAGTSPVAYKLGTNIIYRIGAEANAQAFAFSVSFLFLLILTATSSFVLKTFMTIIGELVVFMFASRGAFAAHSFAIGLYLLLAFILRKKETHTIEKSNVRRTFLKFKVGVFMLIFIIAIPLLFLSWSIFESLVSPAFNMAVARWGTAFQRKNIEGTLLDYGRIRYTKIAKSEIAKFPFFGNFGYVRQEGYSHNTFYDALAQLGIVFGSVLLFIIMLPTIFFVRRYRSIFPENALLFFYLVYFSCLMRGFYSNTLLGEAEFWFVLGILFSYKNSKKADP